MAGSGRNVDKRYGRGPTELILDVHEGAYRYRQPVRSTKVNRHCPRQLSTFVPAGSHLYSLAVARGASRVALHSAGRRSRLGRRIYPRHGNRGTWEYKPPSHEPASACRTSVRSFPFGALCRSLRSQYDAPSAFSFSWIPSPRTDRQARRSREIGRRSVIDYLTTPPVSGHNRLCEHTILTGYA